MCTYNIQIDDSLIARVCPNFSDDSTMERWMQDAVVAQLQILASEQEKRAYMDTFCKEHFSLEFAEEMRERNYLIGQPRPTNDSEFEDIDAMFAEAESSGECSEVEVRRMFSA